MAGAVAAQVVLFAQGGDVNKVLADAREALGGDKKIDAVRALSIEGRALRTNPAGATTESEFEVALELPDKYMRRDAVINMGNMSIYRTSGFNGDGVIDETDTPPQLAGGGHVVMFRTAGPGGATTTIGGAPPTPEQQEATRRAMLTTSKQDFARLTLGMFVKSFAAYPLTMSYAGEAESPDGKADVIEVKGEGDFAARLFIDAKTHLPLMLSWMAREPISVFRQMGGPGGSNVVSPGGAQAGPPGTAGPGQPARGNMTPEEREKLAKQLDEQAKAAEAKRRLVEFRLFYSDYRPVDGIKIPHQIQRSVDGRPTEEVTFDKVKVNPKIDAKKFTVTK